MRESTIQTQICTGLRSAGITFFKITNEVKARAGVKSFGYWRTMKAEGLQAGVPDLCLMFPGGEVIFFEVKRPKEKVVAKKTGKEYWTQGKQSESQKEWSENARKLGFAYYLVDNSQQAVEIAQAHQKASKLKVCFKAEGTD